MRTTCTVFLSTPPPMTRKLVLRYGHRMCSGNVRSENMSVLSSRKSTVPVSFPQ
jgi:hypothetical protein